MDNNGIRQRRQRQAKLRNLLTLDSNDSYPHSYQVYNQQNRNRNNQSRPKHNKHKRSLDNNSTQVEWGMMSGPRDTPKFKMSSNKKSSGTKQSGSKANRIRTQQSEHNNNYNSTKNRTVKSIIGSLKNKLSSTQPKTQIQPVKPSKIQTQFIRRLYCEQNQQAIQVKTNNGLKVLVRTKDAQKKRQYQQDIRMRQIIGRNLTPLQLKTFYRVFAVALEGSQWGILGQHYYHCNWHMDQFYLFLRELKTTPSLIKTLIKQITIAIMTLSQQGWVHGNITLQSIYFPIQNGGVSTQGEVKLGRLGSCCRVDKKQHFLGRSIRYSTPPQIVNFIMFQCGQQFDRGGLQYMQFIRQGWQLDVWSLGVLALQLLNGGLLSGDWQRYGLYQQQHQLLIRYSYLLNNLQPEFMQILTRMLSVDPRNRPRPQQIIRMF